MSGKMGSRRLPQDQNDAALREATAPPAEASLEQEEVRQQLVEKMREVLDRVHGRKSEGALLRYGLGDGYTYTIEEVGREVKVTREKNTKDS